MKKYNTEFYLTRKEIALIEQSIRTRIGHLARTPPNNPEDADNHAQIYELMGVLGTLFNQKIWYGQVNRTGIPLG